MPGHFDVDAYGRLDLLTGKSPARNPDGRGTVFRLWTSREGDPHPPLAVVANALCVQTALTGADKPLQTTRPGHGRLRGERTVAPHRYDRTPQLGATALGATRAV